MSKSRITQMMIFAAGRGARLRPLTDTVPKPLVEVQGVPLIEYHLKKAAAVGIQSVIINVSHLHQQIIERIGHGDRWGLTIEYSIEATPLETAGGLVHARHLFDEGDFLLVNADIYHQINISSFLAEPRKSLHLLMVPNPQEQPAGNFILGAEGLVFPLGAEYSSMSNTDSCFTYGGLGVYSTEFIDSIDQLGSGDPECERIPFYMRRWMMQSQVSGTLFTGLWCDVGTIERLNLLERQLEQSFRDESSREHDE